MSLLYALESLRVPFLNYFFLGITYLGMEALSFVVFFIYYWCINKMGGYFILANCLIGTGINQTFKMVFRIPRPFVRDPDFTVVEEARPTTGGFSFPSGHTQNATSLYGSIAVIRNQSLIRILCAIMIVLVAFSRLYLGAHHPSDVLGGFAIGIAVLIAMTFVFRRIWNHPNMLPALFGVTGGIMVVAGLLFESGLAGGGADPEVMADSLKAYYISAGCILAAAVCEPIERKYISFDTKAVWWAQILKAAIGMGLIGALILLMKYPADAMFGGLGIRYTFRFFVPAAFGICIWPMSFRWFASR